VLLASLIATRNFRPRYIERSTPAWIGHLPFAHWLVANQAPRQVVELGTHYGNSYFTICQSVVDRRLATRCFAVDCWEGDPQAGAYGQPVYEQVRRHNEEYYAEFSTLLRMRFDEALDYFSPGSIDLLHIDGLHTYEAVKHDFETWRTKLSPRGLVLFHDTAVTTPGFGVARFWTELKAGHPSYLEFTHNYGLGVLWPGENGRRGPAAWLQPRNPAKKLVHRIFEQRGIKLAVEHKTRKDP
jgi:hypothetical protein